MKKNKNTEVINNKMQDIFVSVVIILKPESIDARDDILKLYNILNINYTNYEIIIVNNGASLEEIDAIIELLVQVPCIRVIKLSQPSNYDTAIFAGLEVSIGDYVCTIDILIDPIDKIVDFVKRNQTCDVVQGISNTPICGVFGSQIGRRLFYWYNRKYLGIDIPINATYFTSYSRRAINSITSSVRNYKHVRHLARRIGYGYKVQAYTPIKNPSSQRRLRTGVIEALEIVTSYSTHPLRFVTWLGFLASFINIIYAVYILILNIVNSRLEPGWTSISMQLSFMFFILFIIMIILTEYIGRILAESYREPNYVVADELVSTVALADPNRRNVTK
jgi:glycosyltransferase involved in cell wall biosynthesis